MDSLSIGVILLVLLPVAYGSCPLGSEVKREPLVQKTEALGTIRSTCLISDLNMTIAEGGNVKSYDTCLRYYCMPDGLQVCSFGDFAPLIPMDGCKLETKACTPYLVQDPYSEHRCKADILPSWGTTHTPTPDEHGLHSATIPLEELCMDPNVSHLYEYVCSGGLATFSLALPATVAFSAIQLMYFFG